MTKPRRVLAVGDIALTIEMSLGAENIEVAASGGGHDAARRLRADRAFDLVVVSAVLSDMSAYDFVASMLKHMPGLRALVVGAGLSNEQTRALSSTGVVNFTPTVESALALMIPPAPSDPRAARGSTAPFEQSYSEVFDRIVDEARQVAPPVSAPSPSSSASGVVDVDALLHERAALLAEVQAAREELARAAQEQSAMRQRQDLVDATMRAKAEELGAATALAERIGQERDAWKRDSEARRQHVEGLSAQMQTLAEIRAGLERELAATQDLLAEAELARDNAVERTRVEARDIESSTRDVETSSGSGLDPQMGAVSELRDRVGELQAALDAAHVRSAALEETLRDERETRTRVDGELRLLRDERLALDERLRDLSERADQALKIPDLERVVSELHAAVAERDRSLTERGRAQAALEAKLEAKTAEVLAAKRALDDEKGQRLASNEQVSVLEQRLREQDEGRATLEAERDKAIADLEQAFTDIAALERERDVAGALSNSIESVQAALADAERRATSLEKALLDERSQHKESRRTVDERARERDAALEESTRERAAREALAQQLAAIESKVSSVADERRAAAATEISTLPQANDDTRDTVLALQGKLAEAEASAASVGDELQEALRIVAARADAEKLIQKELEHADRAAREATARLGTVEKELLAAHDQAKANAGLALELEGLRAEMTALRATRPAPSQGARADASTSDLSSTVELLGSRVLSLQEEKLVLEKMCDDLRDMLRGANEELMKALSPTPAPARAPTPAPKHDPLAPAETRIAHEMPKVALAERARFLEKKDDDAPPGFDALPSEQAETTRVGVTLPDHLREDSLDVDLFSMEERGEGGST